MFVRKALRYGMRFALMLSVGIVSQAAVSCNDGAVAITLPDVVYFGGNHNGGHDCDDCDECDGCGFGWFYADPYYW